MKDIINKKVSIIGAEESGIAAALLAKRKGAEVLISDSVTKDDKISLLQEKNISFEFGGHSDKVFDCDIFITSPGVPDSSEVLKKAKAAGIDIVSEIEFASWFTDSDIIAITGTNGKTTTTALTQFLLEISGKKSIAAGNIGYGFSNFVDKVDNDTIFVLEISSFQLDHINAFRPNISTIINITPDHLDRYENNFENYIKSKFNILKNVNKKDIFIKNTDDEIITKQFNNKEISVKEISVTNNVENGAYVFEGNLFIAENGKSTKLINKKDIFIKGDHNLINSMVAVLTAGHYNINENIISKGLSTFRGLAHRCEFVRELHKIQFINDSKATNIESTIVALKSYENPLVLILGGREHDNDYSKIFDLVKEKVKKIIAIGETYEKIYQSFSKIKEVIKCDNFQSAIETSYNNSDEGDIVLFSPACKSFDWFQNYKHRGDEFKRIVNGLK